VSEKFDDSEGYEKGELNRVSLMEVPFGNSLRIEFNQIHAKKGKQEKKTVV
jgi:hypothetical protein